MLTIEVKGTKTPDIRIQNTGKALLYLISILISLYVHIYFIYNQQL